MNTKELINAVRDLTFEYQADPITDEYVINRLNEAYRFVYNHYVKSNEEIFGTISMLQIVPGQMEYSMPEELWNKRIETMLIPTPPNESTQPWGWAKVKKMQYSQSYSYQTNRLKTYYPECWSTLNNKIYLFPAPLIAYQAKLIVSRRIPMLGVFGGKITSLGTNTITVDDIANDPRIAAAAGNNSTAFISVCDGQTGEVKALFSYLSVNASTDTITLQASPRSALATSDNTYNNKTIDVLPGTAWNTIVLDDVICFGYATGVSIFGEALDTFLSDWAIMRIRGALNETDPETVNSLKLQLSELTGDLGGRTLGLKMNMTERNNYGCKTFRRSM